MKKFLDYSGLTTYNTLLLSIIDDVKEFISAAVVNIKESVGLDDNLALPEDFPYDDIVAGVSALTLNKMDISAADGKYRTIADAEIAEQVAADAINELAETKQDRLTAGSGITISGNVISCSTQGYDDTVVKQAISANTNAIASINGTILTHGEAISANTSAITEVYNALIDDEMTISKHINALYEEKQNVLTAGSGITISGDVISSNVQPYDDTVVKQAISANTQNIATLSTDKQDKLTAGSGITISGNVISSSVEPYDDSALRAAISANTSGITALAQELDNDGLVIAKHINNLKTTKQDLLTAGSGITISGNVISSNVQGYDDTVVKQAISANTQNIAALQTSKQDTLTAGSGITISGNVISSSIEPYDDTVVKQAISANTSGITALAQELDNTEFVVSKHINNLKATKQDVLTAGSGIIISGNVISSSVEPYDDTVVKQAISANTNAISTLSQRASADEQAISANTDAISALTVNKLSVADAALTYRTIADAEDAEEVAAHAINHLNVIKQNVLTAGSGITISGNVISCNVEGYDDTVVKQAISANTQSIATLSENKQDKLTAGTHISIVNNVISTDVAPYDDSVVKAAISANTSGITALAQELDNTEFVVSKHINNLKTTKQNVLTAGSGITISGDVISCNVEGYDDTAVKQAISANTQSIGTINQTLDEHMEAISANTSGLTYLTQELIKDEFTISKHINALYETKQDILTAGSGITISGNVISCNVEGYDDTVVKQAISANTQSIANLANNVYTKNEIDNTECAISMAVANLDAKKQNRLVAGPGISIVDDVIYCTYSGTTNSVEYALDLITSLTTALNEANARISALENALSGQS